MSSSKLPTSKLTETQPTPLKRKWWFFAGKENPVKTEPMDSKVSGKLSDEKDESFYRAGQWQLVWWKFRRHKLAQIAMVVLAIFYLIVVFAEFISPYDPQKRFKDYTTLPPTKMHLRDINGDFHLPFVYALQRERDPVTLRPFYTEDTSAIYTVVWFAHGDEYKLWGLLKGNVHLFGVESPADKFVPFFLLGSDTLGHDLLSRIFFGARISLTVGLIGVFLAFFIGVFLGGIAGFFGGLLDEVITRSIDVLMALPTIPLWMSLAAALPQGWPQLKTYFYVTIILSIFGWTILARVVRGKLLSLREEDYVMAARLDGESNTAIIARYMLPGFTSYIIVSLTLAIPQMILGETALSFLGVGLRAPTISWGVMLQDAQNLQTVAQDPWLLWPVAFVIVAVLMFNFLGDGLRDAADPYVT
jgi:peptide/nickel transport system permease protein